MTVGERIILFRRSLGISQSELAVVMGCSQVNISQYEKNQTSMSIKYLIPLRKAYAINIDWLLLGIGDMYHPDTTSQQYIDNQSEIDRLKQQLDETQKENDQLKQRQIENQEELLKSLKTIADLQEKIIKQKK